MSARLFRVILQFGDLDAARAFYDCGDAILALLDPRAEHDRPRPNVGTCVFAVDDLDELHARAKRLNGLAAGTVHGEPAGEIATRPWGERSFYARDPWGNLLCVVDAATLFTGR